MIRHEPVAQDEKKVPCSGLREDLKTCLLDTECVKIHRKTPRECIVNNDPSIPSHCMALKNAFFECKRSLLDNRQRFRGRKGY